MQTVMPTLTAACLGISKVLFEQQWASSKMGYICLHLYNCMASLKNIRNRIVSCVGANQQKNHSHYWLLVWAGATADYLVTKSSAFISASSSSELPSSRGLLPSRPVCTVSSGGAKCVLGVVGADREEKLPKARPPGGRGLRGEVSDNQLALRERFCWNIDEAPWLKGV